MKHAAVKPSSAAKSAASRVVATIALATAATAVASPAMANEGHGHGGYGGHSVDYTGGYDDGRDKGRDGGRHGGGYDSGRHSYDAPRSYEPTGYTEPDYDVPQYGSPRHSAQQGDCDRTAQAARPDWDQGDREPAREAVKEYVKEAGKSEAGKSEAGKSEAVTVVEEPAAAAEQPAVDVEAEAPAPAEAAEPVETAASEPPVAVQAPGQQWQGPQASTDTLGAELTAFVPNEGASVEAIEQEASALTEATLDAPVKLATTGAEAAALTTLAGALVIGGAGSLLVARRSQIRA